ncbi:MAG: CPBP family glutamic-type intramembrane protease [Thermoproteota archaeon]
MEGDKCIQILKFKLLQYYGPLRKSMSVKFSIIIFYAIMVSSSFFGGSFIRMAYGFEMGMRDVVNIISLAFSTVIGMGVFLGMRGGITALEPEIHFILTSYVKPLTYLLADLLFQYIFLNMAVTLPLTAFSAVMLYPHLSYLPIVFTVYQLMLMLSSMIAQILGVLRSIWGNIRVEALGWIILALLFAPFLGSLMGLGVDYSGIPYPSTILSKYVFESVNVSEILLEAIYIVIIMIIYLAVAKINYFPSVTPLLTNALMEMPSNRKALRFVPRLFTQILSPKMDEKPMWLMVKLNILRILRDGSLVTALMLFGIATLTNLGFPLLIRQMRFSAFATLTFNILYTPLIPAIFSINWSIVEREALWATATSKDGFRKYVKGMIIAYFIATFCFTTIFYAFFNIILAGTPFLVLDFMLLLSVTIFASVSSVIISLSLSKPSNALSLGAMLYVLIPLFGTIFLSMPVILARTTISISDTPPLVVLLILSLYTITVTLLLSKHALKRTETFFHESYAEEFPKVVFQRSYRSFSLNFIILVSVIMMLISLMELLTGLDRVSQGFSLMATISSSLVFLASTLIQIKSKVEKQVWEPPVRVPWRAPQTILVLFSSIVFSLFLQILPLLVIPGFYFYSKLIIMLGEIGLIIPLLLYLLHKGVGLEYLGLDFSSALSELKIAFLTLPFTILTGILSGIIIQELVPIPPWFRRISRDIAPGSFGDLVGLSLAAILIVAPCEELLFRGFVQRGFESSFGPVGGIILSSIAFGVFHMNPWQFLPSTLIGLILAYLFVKRRRRLWCPLALHALYNVTILALSYSLGI